MRIFSQSLSVLGTVSTVPCTLIVTFTASKMKSEAGSSMSRINSFTDTTGLRSPHSCCGETGAGSAGGLAGGPEDFGEEQAAVTRSRQERLDRQERREGKTFLPFLPFPPFPTVI